MIPKGTLSSEYNKNLKEGTYPEGKWPANVWEKKFNKGDTAFYVIVTNTYPNFMTRRGKVKILNDGTDSTFGWEYRCEIFFDKINQFNLFTSLEEALEVELSLYLNDVAKAQRRIESTMQAIDALKILQLKTAMHDTQ